MSDKKQIYLDNAASSYPKPMSVYNGVYEFMKINGANPGRSGHKMSEEAAAAVFETRQKAADFFNVELTDVIFTKNATEALNIAVFSAVKNGRKTFMTSFAEHNSVLRPLSFAKEEYGTELYFFGFEYPDGKIIPDVVISTSASNVTGNFMPIEKNYEFCKEHGILFIVDASQTAGCPLEYSCDILCTAGHKGLYAPQGSGLLIAKTARGRKELVPMLYGGNGTESLSMFPDIISPESFECGTLNTPAIVGLGLGIDFVAENQKDIWEREKELQKALFLSLSSIEGIKIYTDIDNSVPILAFNIEGVSSENVTAFLDENNICVRGGYHCAPLCHKALGTVPGGVVRVSFGAFNTLSDVEYLTEVIKKIKRQ